jgi:hypothetical protein
MKKVSTWAQVPARAADELHQNWTVETVRVQKADRTFAREITTTIMKHGLQIKFTGSGLQIGWPRPFQPQPVLSTAARLSSGARHACPTTTVSATRFFTCDWTTRARPQSCSVGGPSPSQRVSRSHASGDCHEAVAPVSSDGPLADTGIEASVVRRRHILLQPVTGTWLWLYVVLLALLFACGWSVQAAPLP